MLIQSPSNRSAPSRRLLLAVGAAIAILPARASRATDVHFDYTSFDNPSTPGANPHFGQAQFNVLNYPSINGNYMMTATDDHRPEMLANNNQLAEFYNWLQQRYDAHTTKDGNVSADEIHAYVQNYSPTLSSPKWLILNEMSTSLWPNNATYRAWLIQTATKLHDTYGYNVVTYTTFAGAPGQGADFRALAAKSYIGVENYLSGQEIMNHGTDYASRVAWAQAQYECRRRYTETSASVRIACSSASTSATPTPRPAGAAAGSRRATGTRSFRSARTRSTTPTTPASSPTAGAPMGWA
jgi:hypothetical protein